MITQDDWRRMAAPRTRLAVNTTELLDRDRTVHYVESGAVALYSVQVTAGEISGPRRFLAKLGSGQAMFSARFETPDGLRLLFVPTEETVVRTVELETFWSDAKKHGTELEPLVDGWVHFLSAHIGSFPSPKLAIRPEEDGELTLEEGESLACERDNVRWVKVVEGDMHCFGAPNAVLGSNEPYFPIAGSFWLRSPKAARVVVRRSGSLGDGRQLEDGLWRVHMLTLNLLEHKYREEAAREVERLQERERVQTERSVAAIERLAVVLDPKASRQRQLSSADSDPMLAAMREVGASIGMKIQPASASEGGNVDPVESIARASQVRTRRVVLNGKWWDRDCGSLLGFSSDDERRPLALIRERGGYRCFDPTRGERYSMNGRRAKELLPEGMMLYRSLPDGKLTLYDLVRFGLLGRERDLVMVLVIGGVATVLGMIVPLATAMLMDHAIPDANRRLLVEIGAGLLAVAIGRVVFQLAQSFYLVRVQVASEAETQAAVWDRLLRLRPSFFRRFSSGDLQSRVMAINDIGNQLSGATLSSLFSGFMAVLNLGLLFYFSPKLSMIAIGIATVTVIVTSTVSYFIRRNTKELLEIQGLRYGLEIQLINGVGKLRVGGAGDRAFNHWMKSYSQQMGLTSRNFRLNDAVTIFNQLVPTISAMLLFFFGFSLLSSSSNPTGMSLGIFLAFSAAYGTFLTGVTTLTGTIVSFMDIIVRGRRIQPILEEPAEIDQAKADPGRLTGEIAVHEARFRYDQDGPDILQGVSFQAHPGEFVAVVGPSGSGKSTLMRLLLGFETPYAGTVSFDHQDVASVDVLAVRRQLGVVLQGGQLDAGTVFENIASGNVISLDQAWSAAEDAGLAEDVRKMPMGMHTIISVGGGNLSGGQRQRLLIARALVARPKILLFDEATSALDNRTQAIVSESLERLNVTRVVIAHRLSTIRNADRIFVLESGRKVQEGRFEDLMEEEDGLFARMMQRQMA